MADRLPWIKTESRSGRGASNCLVMVQQPEAEFYKDQGGKSSHLSACVRLVPEEAAKRWTSPFPGHGHPHAERVPLPDPHITLPLSATLLYESGKQVEDTNIFRLMHKKTEPPALELRLGSDGKWWYEGVVCFRLEKVSLRNDGQRFKLQLGMACSSETVEGIHQLVKDHGLCKDDQHHAWLSRWLQGVKSCCTVPITVLSKRKNHAATGGGGGGIVGAGQGAPGIPHLHGAAGAPQRKRTRLDPGDGMYGSGAAGGGGGGVSGAGGVSGGGGVDLSQFTAQMSDMQRSMDRLLDMVESNAQRLDRIETLLSPPTSASADGAFPDSRLSSVPSDFFEATSKIVPPFGGSQDKSSESGGVPSGENGSLPLPLVTRAPSWGPIQTTTGGGSTPISSRPEPIQPPSLVAGAERL